MSAAFAPLVTVDQRAAWESYSVENQGWIENSAYLKAVHPTHRDALHGTIQDHEHDRRRVLQEDENVGISPFIYRYNEEDVKVPETDELDKVFAPLWQVSPADVGAVNVNLLSDARIKTLYENVLEAGTGVLSVSTEIGALVSGASFHS